MSAAESRVTSRFNRTMAVVVWAMAGFAVVAAVWSGDPRQAWVLTGAPLAVLLGWAALWRPYVGVSDDGVRLENVTHRVDVPWAALVHVDTRRALRLHTPSGAFTAWSAPAPGFIAVLSGGNRRADREQSAADAPLTHGDRLGTDSGDAATVIREMWRSRLDAGQVAVGVADQTPVRRHWHVVLIALGLALAVATVALMYATV
ncbi:PH domain-containing protein [Microbacterium hominis]|uniref:PH domain-containing protein n=1 Tax=Microbacterium hominis TaxID=162426 RepID=A0A7D4TQH3_9MICO|nr:PH domain-containing protein [Microbacterium hominis]QKJ19104.1 PH domain-containing protein [Microbacterium hominis]